MRKKDQQADRKDDILGFMQGKIAKWWMPDDVAFVRGNPAYRHRQDPENRAARAVQGLPAADGGGLSVPATGPPHKKALDRHFRNV